MEYNAVFGIHTEYRCVWIRHVRIQKYFGERMGIGVRGIILFAMGGSSPIFGNFTM